MKDTMLAAVFQGNGKLELCDRPVPSITSDDEVLLQVDIASVCGTDVQILATPPGHPANEGAILGHEYVGTVVDAGDAVANVGKGDRVVVDPNLTCGTCAYCRKSLPNMCENMTTLGIFIDGGFTRYNVAPSKALFKISSDVALEEAIFAEPMACVLNGMRKLDPSPGDTAVVLGAGPIGLYFISVLRMKDMARIIVSEPNPTRAVMAERCGATRVLNPMEQDLAEAVKAATGIGADIVIDAVGSLLPDAIASVRKGGTVLLFGMNSKAVAEVRQNDLTRGEIEVVGSFIANDTFPETVSLLESGRLDLQRLVTHWFPLEKINEGIEAMRSGEAIKVIVDTIY